MMQQLDRWQKRVWTYKQPITRIPTQKAVPISDLFAWRNSAIWETCFELYNIPSLIDANTEGYLPIQLSVFDQEGRLYKNFRIEVENGKRSTINLKNFIDLEVGEFGTFAVFHLHQASSISKLNCFVAERGYLSYRYNNAPLRSYVHGNLDAVALLNNGDFELLGANSFLKRRFQLQYVNEGAGSTELFLVNPTREHKRIDFEFFTQHGMRVGESLSINIAPGGIRGMTRQIDSKGPVYAVITSKLVMARPLVFTFENTKMDVFHG